MTPTHFDIYIRQGGRWRRHETLPGDDKEAAILRSVELDAQGDYDGIRAMAVVEYGSGRTPLETLAWISPHLNKTASVQRQMKSQAAAAGKMIAERAAEVPLEAATQAAVKAPGPSMVETPSAESPGRFSVPKINRVAKKKPPVSQVNAAGKVIGSGILAIGITAVLFVPVSALMRSFGGHLGLSGDALQNAIFAVTMIVFVLTASVLMARVYRDYQATQSMVQEAGTDAAPMMAVQPKRKPKPVRTSVEELAPVEAEVQTEAVDTPTEPNTQTDQQKGEEDKSAKTSLTEQMRRAVLQFLADALLAIKDEVPRMNQHVSFGLNLFGAGAAERYGEHAGLKKFQTFVLVREVIGALGNKEDRVDSFCRQFESYRAEERFGMMIQAGRNTMTRNIEGDPNPFEDFGDVVKMWMSDSAARAQAQGIVCIMFTDLVGSTQMTHERGDYGAQEIVRIHNAIVRTALAQHHGREVKHTGDGIMASFTSAGNAVRAGMQIQNALLEHNRLDAAMPVRVRMGLNAGEAVQEEDDFFGTTVQLAARVCDKAGEGEIFITDNVRELSKSQGITVAEAGKFEMKGVPQPMTLYRVMVPAQ